jgi:hypothetical protein
MSIKLKKGALRAMSWLYAVVNPVMDGLDYDMERGEAHPVKHHVISSERPILRDFLRNYEGARSRFELHDLAVAGKADKTVEAVDRELIEFLDHVAAELIEEYDIPAAACPGVTFDCDEE